MRPARRGDARFAGADLLVGSPLGLWERNYFRPLGETVKVFPNFREVSRFALLASEQRLGRIGVRRQRRRGEGSEFHQLRPYRAGDSLRQIDWKASSRYQKLISREYQSERDQQLVFLLDCGRRMRHADAEGEHLDQALNALLLLAYVAARQGDAVGMLARRHLVRVADLREAALDAVLDPDASPGIASLAQGLCGWAPLWSARGNRSYRWREEQVQACRNQPEAR